jgi:hypothetical protein
MKPMKSVVFSPWMQWWMKPRKQQYRRIEVGENFYIEKTLQGNSH